jgi:ribosomal protein S18 acetylase RimI-like enzyme
MSDVLIRSAGQADVATLARAFGDDEAFFADRVAKQAAGHGVLLVAQQADRIVGTVYLWLAEAEEAPIQEHLAGVPLLTHLKVIPDLRNGGIGTQLIFEVERHARERGHSRIALAVEENNEAARRLYVRLDYQDWTHGFVQCDKDVSLLGGPIKTEKCYVFTKYVTSTVPVSSLG